MAETTTRPRRRAYVRVVMVAAALFTAWHIFASFLWIAPYSASAREVVGQERLSNYMIPMFGQSWSVFAPEPINGDYRFEVRALVNGEETEWVSASDVELSMIRYHLFTPRAGIVAMDVSSQYKGAWGDLSEEQQEVVALNYFKADWEERMASALGAGGNDAVEEYMQQERRATAYATQVAIAIWGDDVERIQYRATRQNIIPFEQRHDPDAKRPGIQYSPTGWRGLIVADGQSQEAFTEVFRAQYERMNKS
ncbi:hypothetical protein GCM10010910_27520 [Microbacterium nanhaiense]|uniref:Uncharacterized protein n=1 Tax=Microbacterium nanhaiense TaxID=1301026 RepID=A0ABQ2N3B8_9MICO|nr:DUF5819 family protein [Microbacterium nanhaiense]GGO66927.1 hypothetical protein GCM10010910_27520 [Microbacterium nanhaiense]